MGYSPESIDAFPAPIIEHFMFSAPLEAREDYEDLAIKCELLARLSQFVFKQAHSEDFIYSGASSETLGQFVDFLFEWEEDSKFPPENLETLLIAIAKSFPYIEQSDKADILGDELLYAAALKLRALGEPLESCHKIVSNIEHPDFRDQAHQQLADNL